MQLLILLLFIQNVIGFSDGVTNSVKEAEANVTNVIDSSDSVTNLMTVLEGNVTAQSDIILSTNAKNYETKKNCNEIRKYVNIDCLPIGSSYSSSDENFLTYVECQMAFINNNKIPKNATIYEELKDLPPQTVICKESNPKYELSCSIADKTYFNLDSIEINCNKELINNNVNDNPHLPTYEEATRS
ncbi:hypothetical protein BCR32DRAFT_297477 [Anaeromyces robustus]|uniref:Uncharacterized protein n=1 Tax=Anaeromyces robustus TaxID=1754192 RepID=A0A1Y1W6A9_9FUNG|nr:hypothetical protein BCR32DRAFT_297477 [Anaeromyces robustus]|eukprot:ORX68868.1 hypothetical protein BCR32DRAFT_297477 [Anaeromyces robustus]